MTARRNMCFVVRLDACAPAFASRYRASNRSATVATASMAPSCTATQAAQVRIQTLDEPSRWRPVRSLTSLGGAFVRRSAPNLRQNGRMSRLLQTPIFKRGASSRRRCQPSVRVARRGWKPSGSLRACAPVRVCTHEGGACERILPLLNRASICPVSARTLLDKHAKAFVAYRRKVDSSAQIHGSCACGLADEASDLDVLGELPLHQARCARCGSVLRMCVWIVLVRSMWEPVASHSCVWTIPLAGPGDLRTSNGESLVKLAWRSAPLEQSRRKFAKSGPS